MSEKWNTYLFEYHHDGATWSIEIKASSEQDALARLDKLQDAKYLGVLQMKLRVEFGIFARLLCLWHNWRAAWFGCRFSNRCATFGVPSSISSTHIGCYSDPAALQSQIRVAAFAFEYWRPLLAGWSLPCLGRTKANRKSHVSTCMIVAYKLQFDKDEW